MTTEMAMADSERTIGGPLVLHVRVVTATGGGPEKTILNSPRFLNRLGYRSLVAFMHPPGDPGFDEIRRRGQEAGAEVISIPDRGPWDWRPLLELISLCRRENVAIWHGHDYKSNVFGLLVRRFHRMRLATTAHGWGAVVGRVPLYNRIDLAVLPFYEKVVCVSDDIANKCRTAGVRSDRICTIENAIAIDQHSSRQTTDAARERLGIPCGCLMLGAVGRLSPEKGFDILIEAVANLRDTGLDVGLAIAGEGPERTRLEDLIASLPDPSRFLLLGHQSEISVFYSAIDIFSISSLSEGLPNVLLEAMAFGLPVVATRVGGVARVIEDGSNGVLVDPGDVQTLTNAIRHLIEDPEMSQKLGCQGRHTIETRYSFQRRMERITSVYRLLSVLPCNGKDEIGDDRTRLHSIVN